VARDAIPIPKLHEVSPLLNVRAWHNEAPRAFGGISAHPTIEIAWIEEGETEYSVGTQTARQRPGQVVIIPAGVEHVTRVFPGVRIKVVGLSPTVVEEVADAMNARADLQACLGEAPPRLVALGELLYAEATERAAGHEIVLDALTEAIAVQLVRASQVTPVPAGTRPKDLRIRRATAFIESSYAEPLSLGAMAKAAGMSRFHFSRLFEADVGVSPYRYLLDVRVSHAAALLRSGRVNVTEAALTVGFNDLGRFARAFRARYGLSPREALGARRSLPRTFATSA
jgi:AraC family transcriptional regulator